MKKNKLFIILSLIAIIAWLVIIIKQQGKLIDYQQQIDELAIQIENAEDKLKQSKQELSDKNENVKSLDYIEKLAREKLGMYLPNERVFVDNNM